MTMMIGRIWEAISDERVLREGIAAILRWALESHALVPSNSQYSRKARTQSRFPYIIPTLMKSEEDLNHTFSLFWDLESIDIVTRSQEKLELTPHKKKTRKKVECTTQSATNHRQWQRGDYS